MRYKVVNRRTGDSIGEVDTDDGTITALHPEGDAPRGIRRLHPLATWEVGTNIATQANRHATWYIIEPADRAGDRNA